MAFRDILEWTGLWLGSPVAPTVLPFIRVTIPPYITHEDIPPFVTDATIEPTESGGDVAEYVTHQQIAPYRTDRRVP